MRIGSLFAGYGGLEMGLQSVLGGHVAWHSEIDPAASRVLARHWPGVPNLGDITTIDWARVPRVDILTGGFPCQDVSTAGRQAGLRPGTRSGLWSHFAYAIDQLRPSLVVAENVRGLLSAGAHSDVEPCPWCVGDGEGEPALRALGAVLGDLAELGYDAAWHGLRAADVGAPHGRFRIFIVAWPTADADGVGSVRGWGARGWRDGSTDHRFAHANAESDGRNEGRPESAGLERGSDAAQRCATPADARCQHGQWGSSQVGRGPRSGGSSAQPERPAETPADTDVRGCERLGRVDTLGCDPHGRGGADVAWGDYEPAIRRWEAITGRRAPNPTEAGRTGPRLSAALVEWMMGLPAGHVAATEGLSRNDMLRCLGNGVVPQQAAEALRMLLPHAIRAGVAA